MRRSASSVRSTTSSRWATRFSMSPRGNVVEAGLEAKELAASLEDVESGFLKGDPDGSADLAVLAEDVESGDPGLAGGRAGAGW